MKQIGIALIIIGSLVMLYGLFGPSAAPGAAHINLEMLAAKLMHATTGGLGVVTGTILVAAAAVIDSRPQPAAPKPSHIAIGARVAHPEYGTGTVMSLRDGIAAVKFQDGTDREVPTPFLTRL